MRRLVLSPRWILWHLLTIGAMAACGWLAAWQWERAGSAMGSAVNVGYGLQWPVFAVFFAVMWWRFLRMELHDLREREQSEPGLPERELMARGLAERAVADRGLPERATAAPPVDAAGPLPLEHPQPAQAGQSPFTRTPRRPAPTMADGNPHRPAAADMDPELAEYNRMLARLAERDSSHRR